MPNVLTIVLDDVNGWLTLAGSYGGQLHTPNIDRLASMGVSFTEAHAAVPLCNPSRTSVLSGMSPLRTGVVANTQPMFEAVAPEQTLPMILGAAGWETAVAGKVFHHLSTTEAGRVYDHVLHLPGEMVERGQDGIIQTTKTFPAGVWTGDPALLADSRTVSAVEDFLAGYVPQPGGAGLLLDVGLINTHAPWVVPQEFFDLYPLNEIVLPERPAGDLDDVPEYGRLFADPLLVEQMVAADDWRARVQAYLATISFMDAMVGRLLDALAASTIADDTMVALWSDNGFHMGDKESVEKNTLWASATRTPLIIADPSGARVGAVEEQVVSLPDLYPTILAYAGLPVPEWASGHSLLELVRSGDTAGLPDMALTMLDGSYSLRTAQYRYTRYEDGGEELYDVLADPREYVNLAADPAAAATRTTLSATLDAVLAEHGIVQEYGSTPTRLEGDANANLMVAGFGADTLVGGEGSDTYLLRHPGQIVVEGIGGGTDTVLIGAGIPTYVIPDQVERVAIGRHDGVTAKPLLYTVLGNGSDNSIRLGEAAMLSAYGADGNDTISAVYLAATLDGGEGDDSLIGHIGADRLLGGAGNDLMTGSLGPDTLLGGTGNDTLAGHDDADVLQGGPGEDRLVGGAGNDQLAGDDDQDHLFGEDGNDTLSGDAGDDYLNGGLGADSMSGGAGNDTFLADNAGDVATDSGGSEIVIASLSYTLADGLETLLLTGAGDLSGTGHGGANWIIGNAGANSLAGLGGADTLSGGDGADMLDGGTGADSLNGGMGNDLFIFDDAGDLAADSGGADTLQSSVSVTLAVGVEVLMLIGGARDGAGNASDNTILGNALGNLFNGASGNDTLDGADGADTLQGELGSDSLIGGNGADSLNGTGGADTMNGGMGDDAYVVDDAGDVLSESGGGGTDTVFTSRAFTLATGFENLTLIGGDTVSGTGNAVANTIIGNNAANNLAGGGGNDSLRGENGNDMLTGGAGADTMAGGIGADRYSVESLLDVLVEAPGEGTDFVIATLSWTLAADFENLQVTGVAALNGTGNTAVNRITGNDGGNRLEGLGANDVLIGGAGADTLDGGAGGGQAARRRGERPVPVRRTRCQHRPHPGFRAGRGPDRAAGQRLPRAGGRCRGGEFPGLPRRHADLRGRSVDDPLQQRHRRAVLRPGRDGRRGECPHRGGERRAGAGSERRHACRLRRNGGLGVRGDGCRRGTRSAGLSEGRPPRASRPTLTPTSPAQAGEGEFFCPPSHMPWRCPQERGGRRGPAITAARWRRPERQSTAAPRQSGLAWR